MSTQAVVHPHLHLPLPPRAPSRLPRAQVLRCRRLLSALVLAALIALPSLTWAARSGSSFGGRSFRSSGGFSSSRNYGSRVGGGHSVFFLPSFGWGWGGMGGGGGGGLSSLLVLAVLGFGAFSLIRAVNRYRNSQGGGWGWNPGGGDADVAADRGYVYRMQLAFGRSARGLQDRLARFAAEGDTSSEAGLASMLHQVALEMMREKDAIRSASIDASGPMSLTNAETKMNGLALAERSRFQVERLRGADGKVRRSEAAAEEGKEALEYVVVTVVVATRNPLGKWKQITDRTDVDLYLGQLGGVTGAGLLGVEVVWTPADPNDSMTETDVMTTYPEMRNL